MPGVLRRLRVPHVLALLTFIVLVASILTYIIPSGQYERETKVINDQPRTLLVPGTYQSLRKSYGIKDVLITTADGSNDADGAPIAKPTSLHGFLSSIPRGLAESQDIVFFIFIIGGALGVVQRTGAITAAIRKMLDHLGHSSVLMTIVVMVVLAIGGSTLGMGEEFIPLVPVFLMLSRQLGYDRIYAMALGFLSADVGFTAATTNPFTVQVAQGIAQLQPVSGWPLRSVFFVAAITLTLIHVLRYGARIKANPAASLASFDEAGDEGGDDLTSFDDHPFTHRHLWILVSCGVIFAGVLVAVQELNWWMEDMAGGFVLMGIIAAIIGRLSINEAAESFAHGMRDMVVAAIVVGFARAIAVVFDEAHVMDTIIHSAAGMLESVPRYVSVEGMLIFQATLNFWIPSGSGQAAVTMPLMAPLARASAH